MWPFRKCVHHVNVTVQPERLFASQLHGLELRIRGLERRMDKMPTKEEFDALIGEIRSGVDATIARIAELERQLADGGMTADEEEAIFAKLQALKNSLPSGE